MPKILKFLILVYLLAATTSYAAAQQQDDGQAYLVQAGDSLMGLAEQFYQTYAAWPAIQMATNAKAAQDSRFSVIENPDQLAAGQLLWIPGPDEAERLLGAAFRSARRRPSPSRPNFWPNLKAMSKQNDSASASRVRR
jgi:hypothetical protein